MSEFSLIEKYFSSLGEKREDVLKGVGDDAAILSATRNNTCICTDTLIRGVHFPPSSRAEDIGYKSLAVNLSDIAAMGATPKWATLALTLSDKEDDAWVNKFADGLGQLAKEYQVQVVGGDTTRGEQLLVTITVVGEFEDGHALRRDAANEGDLIYVTGTIGDAVAGLKRSTTLGNEDYFVNRLNRPQPRVEDILKLKPFITSAIDISDGLVADLTHVLKASGIGAEIDLSLVPVHPGLSAMADVLSKKSLISGGDDYEICFTVAPKNQSMVEQLAQRNGIPVTLIGYTDNSGALVIKDAKGNALELKTTGYDHFAEGVL